ncbi:unnamed protein product, partial [Candidula unifasciata]
MEWLKQKPLVGFGFVWSAWTMLHNAVTIRLNRMTQTAFLSPLLTFFVDALANILAT